MSGGHFDYVQHRFLIIAEELDSIIRNNNSDKVDEWGDPIGRNYSPEIIARLKETQEICKRAYTYVHRADWFLSGDDGEQEFLARLEDDLKNLG